MRPAVDPACEARHYDDTCRAELPPQRSRHVGPVVAAGARADDRNRSPSQEIRACGPAYEEAGRWVVDRLQPYGKPCLGTAEPAEARCGQPTQLGRLVEAGGETRKRARRPIAVRGMGVA